MWTLPEANSVHMICAQRQLADEAQADELRF